MAAVKRRLKVPPEVESVHTATVGGYFVEGHAHAEDIQELLRDRPEGPPHRRPRTAMRELPGGNLESELRDRLHHAR